MFGGYVEVKSFTQRLSRDFVCRRCERNSGVAMEQDETCNEAETLRQFTYLGDGCKWRMGGGCDCWNKI